jgi:hypothetical protein
MASLFSKPKMPSIPAPVAPPPPPPLPGESDEDKKKLSMARKREIARLAGQRHQDVHTSALGDTSAAASVGKTTLG